ncbi:PF08331 domain protein [Peptostreptococcaceae bacterium AS15]|nr:PF08331 domain protein [Peptostreptococcaceae bacterium AS15]
MSIIDEAIKSLDLGYEIEYSTVSLMDENFICLQEDFLKFLEKRKKDGKISPLESSDIEKRAFPQKILQGAKTVITFLFPYMTSFHKDGNLSYYCMGLDYHIGVKNSLDRIVKYIGQYHKDAKFYIQSDIGELDEKFFAYNSGLGILGLNSLIISPLYGTYVNIGVIVTDLKFKPKIAEKKICDMCMKCQNSCPGKAINGDFTIESQKCASYITQKKGELSKDEIEILKKSGKIFGCDICQKVCHFNKNVKKISSTYDIINSIEKDDLQISNKEFKLKYGDRAFSFRGKSVLSRNIDLINIGEEIE